MARSGISILNVIHPAPVRMRSRRAGTERLDHRAIATPVHAVDIPPAAMRLVLPELEPDHGSPAVANGGIPGPKDDWNAGVWEAEGRLWSKVAGILLDIHRVPVRCPVARRSFINALEDPRMRCNWPIAHARVLAATPLLAALPGRRQNPYEEGGDCRAVTWGENDVPVGGAMVDDDLTLVARDGLRSMFETGIRFVGDEVFVPFEGIHRLATAKGGSVRSWPHGWGETLEPRFAVSVRDPGAICLRAGRATAIPGSELQPDASLCSPDAERYVSAGIAAPAGNRDIVLHANEAPGRVIHALGTILGNGEDVEALIAPLRPWGALGSIGCIDEGDALEVLELVRVAALAGAAGPAKAWRVRDMDMLASYVASVAVPGLTDGHLSLGEDDLAALDGIGGP